MDIYKGICKVTNKQETIWYNRISAKTFDNPNGTIIGIMSDCSVCKRLDIDMCENCNIYKQLKGEF